MYKNDRQSLLSKVENQIIYSSEYEFTISAELVLMTTASYKADFKSKQIQSMPSGY